MSAYDFLEPLAAEKAKENGLPHIEACLLSIAVSQKRVADALQFNTASQATALISIQNTLSSIVEQPNSYNSGPAIRTKSG